MPIHEITPDLEDHEYSHNNQDNLKDLFETVEKLIQLRKEDDFIETSIAYLNMFKSFYNNQKLPIPYLAGFTTLVIDYYKEVFPCFAFYETKRS